MLVGALIAAALSAVLLTLVARHREVDQDALLGLLLASFFSVGVIVVSRHATFTADLTQLLFGQVLTVTTGDVLAIAAVAIVALAVLFLLRKEMLFRAFDPIGATALGYSPFAIDMALNMLIALVVVAAVRAVGTALVVALLTTPAATARLLSNRVAPMMVWSCGLAAASAWPDW